MDYDAWPLPDSDRDTQTVCGGALLEVLLGGNPNGLNPKEKIFVDFNPAGERRGGVARGVWEDEATGTRLLLDAHGRPFVVVFDTGGDGQVTDPRTGRAIAEPAIVYGHGKDFTSIDDDILSWD